MDVALWIAVKNFLKGEWTKILEVTPYLLEKLSPEDDENHTIATVLQAQVVSAYLSSLSVRSA